MEIKKVYIVGAGYMGTGIAQTALMAGYEVILYDILSKKTCQAKEYISAMLEKLTNKGKISEEQKISSLAKFSISNDLVECASSDIVIEAIIENVVAKKELLTKITGFCKEDAIIASNTSSISITELSTAVTNSHRFVGMHFFSPVPLMKLLEIIRGLNTSSEIIEKIMCFGESLGKVCIISKDSAGFIVNRILDPMINEAIGVLDMGVAKVEDIDNGMKFGCNHPMGPLELADMVGLDIELAVMEVLYAETGDSKYRPSTLLKNMVRGGYLGKKVNKGFYIYKDGKDKVPNTELFM